MAVDLADEVACRDILFSSGPLRQAESVPYSLYIYPGDNPNMRWFRSHAEEYIPVAVRVQYALPEREALSLPKGDSADMAAC